MLKRTYYRLLYPDRLAQLLEQLLTYVHSDYVYPTYKLYELCMTHPSDEELDIKVQFANNTLSIASYDSSSSSVVHTYLSIMSDEQYAMCLNQSNADIDCTKWDNIISGAGGDLTYVLRESRRYYGGYPKLIAYSEIVTPFIHWLFQSNHEPSTFHIGDTNVITNLGSIGNIHNEFAILNVFTELIKSNIGPHGRRTD